MGYKTTNRNIQLSPCFALIFTQSHASNSELSETLNLLNTAEIIHCPSISDQVDFLQFYFHSMKSH